MTRQNAVTIGPRSGNTAWWILTAALLSLAAVAAAPAAFAAPPTARTVTQLSGDLDVHDPAPVTDGPGVNGLTRSPPRT